MSIKSRNGNRLHEGGKKRITKDKKIFLTTKRIVHIHYIYRAKTVEDTKRNVKNQSVILGDCSILPRNGQIMRIQKGGARKDLKNN